MSHRQDDDAPHPDRRHGSAPDWIDCLRTATAFLTRLPVSTRHDHDLARATNAFPLVGAMVGLVAGLAYLLAWWLSLGPWLAAIAAVLAAIALTGALHEDGLADVADGLGARGEREGRLAAMRDSRIGAFGVIALVLALGARIGGLAELHGPATVILTLVAAGAVSRAAVVVAMRYMPPARADGLGAGAGTPDMEEMLVAIAVAAVLAVAMLLPWGWLPAILFGGGFAWVIAWRARVAFGGQTGDVLGAIQQAAEIGVICAAAAVT
jgi:adenosylcobinamide-GDP ribazoletransferase